MNLRQEVDVWANGSDREWQLIEERLPSIIERANASPSLAVARLHRRLMDIAMVTPGRASSLKVLSSIADRAVAEELSKNASVAGASLALLSLVDLANVLECVGCPVQQESWSTIRSWLGRIGVSRDDERAHYYWTTGFAALALDDRLTYARFAGYRGGILPSPDMTQAAPPRGPFPFEPHQTFPFNLNALLAYLAGAVELHAAEADVLPAWENLLECFPDLRDAKSADQGTLFWIARIVLHRIGGHPLGEVAQRLHDSAWRLAGLEP